MADDLDLGVRSIEGESPSPDFLASLRERVLAEAAARTNDGVIVEVELEPLHEEERTMNTTRWLLAGAAAAVIALVVGLVAVTGDDDTTPTPAQDPTTVPAAPASTEAPAATTATISEPESAGTPGADAGAGCGLSDSASIVATVESSAESVTIDVSSDPSCGGVDVEVVATPWEQGFPIERRATLDDTGAASVSDHLLGTRSGDQDWKVELLVSDTRGVAATSSFAVTGVCDLDTADLSAAHLPETDEVDIVFTVDPACAGETFTFDRDGIFASSPPGGWEVYVVDDRGRIEVTEQLVVDGPVIDVLAIPVAEDRGINTGDGVARVTLDISR